MQYTLIFIFNSKLDKVLMAHKTKGPYPGCLNGVGGKVDASDLSVIDGALREIEEETGLGFPSIAPLQYLVTECFPSGDELNVFCTVMGDGNNFEQLEEERLEWFKVEELLDVKDPRLAGDGGIPYFLTYSLNVLKAMDI